MRSQWTVGAYVLVFIALAVLPAFEFGTSNILTLLISLFTIASLASSWNILAGLVGRINLGHASFFGLGALTTRELWLSSGWHPGLAFIVGGAVAALAALIIGAPALRLKGIYFSVGTLALAEAMRLTVGNVLPRISRLPGADLRSYDLTPRYLVALGVLVGIVVVIYWLRHSKLGLGMMAVREDEEAAKSIGVNVFKHTLIAFVLSAFLAGLVGGSFAYYHVSYYPSFPFGPEWTFEALLVTFIGGIGTLVGPLVGAVFFVLISDLLASNPSLLNVHLIIFGALFIVVVLALPGGIIQIAGRLRQWLIDPTRAAQAGK
jgi:branched-chain amino acid transport system permease protein